MDSQMGVIDFSLYLRRGPACGGAGTVGLGGPDASGGPTAATAADQDSLTTVLDQKNYIEELNRHLK